MASSAIHLEDKSGQVNIATSKNIFASLENEVNHLGRPWHMRCVKGQFRCRTSAQWFRGVTRGVQFAATPYAASSGKAFIALSRIFLRVVQLRPRPWTQLLTKGRR